jgi:hypothetical protein
LGQNYALAPLRLDASKNAKTGRLPERNERAVPAVAASSHAQAQFWLPRPQILDRLNLIDPEYRSTIVNPGDPRRFLGWSISSRHRQEACP